MRIQLLIAPPEDLSVSLRKIHLDPPYGAMCIASALMEDGHEVRIESCHIERMDNAELVRRIREFKPDIIGISALIATSYKYVKDISFILKSSFKDLKIIVGGGLGACAETLLKNSCVDIVVVGEGDATAKELVERIAKKDSYNDVKGIVFKEKDAIVKTPPRAPLKMDTLGYPAFDLIDMNTYLIDIRQYMFRCRSYNKNPDKRLYEGGRSKNMLRVYISKGCVGTCTFCYRVSVGFRHFSIDYIMDYLEYLMDKFGINIFSFGDDCHAPNKEWNRKFLEALKKRKLNIMFQILGMRVDTVDRDILRAYKEAGCFMIEYGIESGSQKMLDVMNKRTTVQENLDALKWSKEAGIYVQPNLLLGMPGETTETVKESIDFLKKIDYGPYRYQFSYAFAVPGSALYEYGRLTGLIKDEDKYLEWLYSANLHNLLEKDSFINFTSDTLSAARSWPSLIEDSLLRHFSSNWIAYMIHKHLRLANLFNFLKTKGLKETVLKIYRRIFKKEGIYVPRALDALAESRRKGELLEDALRSVSEDKTTLFHVVKRLREKTLKMG